jgi:hypothetical protein
MALSPNSHVASVCSFIIHLHLIRAFTRLASGRCQLAQLTNFLGSSQGVQLTADTRLQQLPGDNTTVYAVLMCMSGFINTGGSLNVTCNTDGNWSRLPNCVLNSGGVMTTTTMPPSTSGRCPYTTASFTIANGFLSQTNNLLLFPDTSTASGSVMFGCQSGFTIDPSIGATMTCVNGAFTPQPRCLSEYYSLTEKFRCDMISSR